MTKRSVFLGICHNIARRLRAAYRKHNRRTYSDMRSWWGWDNELCGACAIGAYAVYRWLVDLGFKPRLVTHPGYHFWVECADVIIDPTAHQMGGPRLGFVASKWDRDPRWYKYQRDGEIITMSNFKFETLGWGDNAPTLSNMALYGLFTTWEVEDVPCSNGHTGPEAMSSAVRPGVAA